MHRRSLVPVLAAGTLVLPAVAADAHVTVHPNGLPAGSYATTNIRVPNEEDNAATTSVRVQLPSGITYAAAAPPPGWRFATTQRKLATPIKTADGTITSEVATISFTGGRIPPGQFQSFPIVLAMPASAQAGQTLKFPAIQTYSNGEVVRWIGSPSAEHPAPTVDVTPENGPILDVAGDAGTASRLAAKLAAGGVSEPATRTVEKKETSTLSVIALIVAALGLLAGGAALAGRRRTA